MPWFHFLRMMILQVMVKSLGEQRADSREENKDGTSSRSVAALFGHLEAAK